MQCKKMRRAQGKSTKPIFRRFTFYETKKKERKNKMEKERQRKICLML